MTQCSHGECRRPYFRTRPDPDTGQPAPFCLWHPFVTPPPLEALPARSRSRAVAPPSVPPVALPEPSPAVKPARNISDAGRAAMQANAGRMRARRLAKALGDPPEVP